MREDAAVAIIPSDTLPPSYGTYRVTHRPLVATRGMSMFVSPRPLKPKPIKSIAETYLLFESSSSQQSNGRHHSAKSRSFILSPSFSVCYLSACLDSFVTPDD